MARNGSGTFSPSVDFATEAASPPIEISKLDTVIADIGDEITNSIAADGQTTPTANLKMGGFRHTNVAAATALTDYVRLSEMIDQDHVYYVDTGAADAYVITPNPDIAAYEEGQRFVFRAANANTGASTLNVNSRGAVAIQTADGEALAAGAIVAGGYYEVIYDANASPDRWVLMSSPSYDFARLSQNNTFTGNASIGGTLGVTGAATLSSTLSVSSDATIGGNLTLTGTLNSISVSDFARLSQANTFTSGTQNIAATGTVQWAASESGTSRAISLFATTTLAGVGTQSNHDFGLYSNGTERLSIGSGGNFDFKAGTVTTANSSASEVGYKGAPVNSKTADHTIVAADAGNVIVCSSSADDITVQASGAPPAGSVVGILNKTGGSIDIIEGSGMTLTLAATALTGNRTLIDNGMAFVYFDSTSTAIVGGTGVA